MLVLEGLVGLHPTIQLQLLQITGWAIDLDYCDIVWFALEMNRDHSVIFEIAPNNYTSDCVVDYEGYSFLLRGLAYSSKHNGHLSLILPLQSILFH